MNFLVKKTQLSDSFVDSWLLAKKQGLTLFYKGEISMNLKPIQSLMFVVTVLFSLNALAHNDYHHPYPEMWTPAKDVNWRAVKNFNQPMVDGYRLDFCYKNNEYCGRAAANQFCRKQGFQYSTQFHIERRVGETRNIADNHVNKDGCYDGFHFIRCRN